MFRLMLRLLSWTFVTPDLSADDRHHSRSGAASYKDAIGGLGRGVDNRGSSMDVFMGKEVLTELAVLGRVGVYVDKADLTGAVTLNDTQNVRPYLYFYQAEDIFSWRFDAQNNLTHVLLRDREFTVNPDIGLVDGLVEKFRLLELVDNGVQVRFFDIAGGAISWHSDQEA